MELRPELMPPHFDEALVRRLCELAEELDDCSPQIQDCDGLRAEFNQLAGTSMMPTDFAFSGATDAETFVRGVLSTREHRRVPDISRAEFIELIRRVCEAEGTEHEIDYWLNLLRVNLPDERVSDLIFWPDQYFEGDPDAPEDLDLTPEQILDVAQSRGPAGVKPLPAKL